ncbi:hypothetical protein DMH18_25975 [Streptomyces sp. WAC 06783]|nr:hypothetical protein DMH18_25975 [Streptomyces sp. WAC 06783]
MGRIWGVWRPLGSGRGESAAQLGTTLKGTERPICAGQSRRERHNRRSSRPGRRLHDIRTEIVGHDESRKRTNATTRNYLAFLGLAAALCCYKRLLRLTL